jgi:hypothetical protein
VVLIHLLPVPATTGAGSLVPLAETRRELAERFAGATAYLRSPAQGLWTASDSHTEEDNVVMVEVVTNAFDRRWWRDTRPDEGDV